MCLSTKIYRVNTPCANCGAFEIRSSRDGDECNECDMSRYDQTEEAEVIFEFGGDE